LRYRKSEQEWKNEMREEGQALSGEQYCKEGQMLKELRYRKSKEEWKKEKREEG
jgi:hypothetical protein